MRTHTSLLVVLILTASLPAAEPLLTGPALVPPQVVGREWNPRLTPVVKVVKRCNAVVNIRSERMTHANGPQDLLALETSQNHVNGMGTGIIIDPRGYIVTNQHVVEGVESLRVRLADGTSLPGRVVARDRDADLALLKVDAGGRCPSCRWERPAISWSAKPSSRSATPTATNTRCRSALSAPLAATWL